MPDANEAFSRLFAESQAALRRYVRRLVSSRDTAEEVVQEAFLRTYEQRAAVQTPRAFLFSTARNLAWKIRRHEAVAPTDTLGDFDDSGVDTQCLLLKNEPLEDGLIADEASRLLKEAVDALPPQCRAAFTLKVFHAFSYREIATRLGISEKTVEKHIARGLKDTHLHLRRRYAPQDTQHTERGADHG